MFDLPGTTFPGDFEALRQGLEAAVRQRIELPPDRSPVRLATGRPWPEGESLVVDFSDGLLELPRDLAQLRAESKGRLKPPAIVADREPGPSFKEFRVLGEPLRVGEMACRLKLEARDVQFDYGRDADGTAVVAPSGGSGVLTASVPKQQFLAYVRQQAVDSSAEKGFAMEQADLDLSSPDHRTIAIKGTLAGRKNLGFLSPRLAIDFTAALEIDDDLVGHLRTLDLHGQGMVLEALLNLLRPKVNQFKSRPIPLRDVLGAFVPAGLEVRDLRVDVSQDVSLHASFGDSGAPS
jgi:hypothetical protein